MSNTKWVVSIKRRNIYLSIDTVLPCGSEQPDVSCSRLYLQVQGMLQPQPVKLLILQLEETLTVGKALGQLWEETRQSEEGSLNWADESRRLILTGRKLLMVTVFQGVGNNNPNHEFTILFLKLCHWNCTGHYSFIKSRKVTCQRTSNTKLVT